MFNIAFPELVVIVLVSLIFIGPDKLPKVAQTLGMMMGRMQRFMSAVKDDIDQELKNNDLLRLQEELKLQQEGLNDDLRKGMQPVADVIRRPETTVSEIPDPDSTQPIVIDTDPQKTTVKPEGIST
ncbi:MAG TPA: twin-arginine translocase subunit TatB [Methylophaga aminisulfidivorans]|uniref:Twin-arginine translocase subunit TatB n=2 Tax=root TaxID=1 RepID=A0A7C1W3W9_9GAMM|nr:twin-arginine translocase subunit TatB [Methylophaga aminisulfidivorans]